jgi:hypothetical protein
MSRFFAPAPISLGCPRRITPGLQLLPYQQISQQSAEKMPAAFLIFTDYNVQSSAFPKTIIRRRRAWANREHSSNLSEE